MLLLCTGRTRAEVCTGTGDRSSSLAPLPREAQERQDERDEAAVDEAPQDLLLLRRVGRVPRRRLAAEAADQDRLLVAEAVEAELAVVAARPAVAHAAEGQVRVRELDGRRTGAGQMNAAKATLFSGSFQSLGDGLVYMQRDVVHEHPSRGDVRHKGLLQLLVLGEEVGRKRLRLGVHHVNAVFDLLDLETQFQKQRFGPVSSTYNMNYSCYMKAEKYY